MEQPEGSMARDDKGQPLVCKLKHALYGLKQSGRVWFRKLVEHLKGFGLEQSKHDPCLFFHGQHGKEDFIAMTIYVDDMLIAAATADLSARLIAWIRNKFDLSDVGAAKWVLGIHVVRQENGNIRLDQSAYAKELVQRFGMEDARPVTTPCDINSNNVAQVVPADAAVYRQVVGALNYLATVTRPDISYAVSQAAKYMATPSTQQMEAARRILRYLKAVPDLGIEYKHGKPVLEGYSDADWARDKVTRKSLSGILFLLAGGPVSWSSKQQRTVALSSMEAEYMALSSAVQQAVHLRGLLNDMTIGVNRPTTIFVDSQSAIKAASNPITSERSKHIDTRYHYTREMVENGVVALEYVPTTEMTADCLTKPLGPILFKRLVSGIVSRCGVEGAC